MNFKEEFYLNFIQDDRWRYITRGLGTTFTVTIFAVILGVALGIVIALIRSTADKSGSKSIVLKIVDGICKVYLTVIRGTPAMIQLLIMYYIVFASPNVSKQFVAILSFGINSAAYVAEIFRSGIMSIDNGQFEAGRSLGFSYAQTMIYIIIPQAFKNVLPALANEFIVLLKETSVAGYVGLTDLTYAGNIVGGNSYDYLFPLLVTAIIYLIMVLFFTYLVGRLERRLRNSER